MAKRLPTVGLGSSDLAASVRFYGEALGLHPVGPASGERQILSDDRHVRLAIEQRDDRTPPRGPIATIANLGLTNLTFYAPALDPVIASIEAAGGSVLRETRVDLGPGREGVFCADPDNVPIELISGSDAVAFIHVVGGVSDLARSTAILSALDYSAIRDIDIAQPSAPISQFVRLPDARMRARVFQHRDGGEIELIEMLHPKSAGTPGVTAAPDAPGLRYIAIEVDDLDATISTLAAIGLQGARTIDPASGRAAWHGMDFDSTRLRCLGQDRAAK